MILKNSRENIYDKGIYDIYMINIYDKHICFFRKLKIFGENENFSGFFPLKWEKESDVSLSGDHLHVIYAWSYFQVG